MRDRRVWKYEIQQGAESSIELPVGAKLLHADQIDGEVCVWALVRRDSREPRDMKIRTRNVGYFLTGLEPIPEDWEYVDTIVVKPSGGVADDTITEVLHVFADPST